MSSTKGIELTIVSSGNTHTHRHRHRHRHRHKHTEHRDRYTHTPHTHKQTPTPTLTASALLHEDSVKTIRMPHTCDMPSVMSLSMPVHVM